MVAGAETEGLGGKFFGKSANLLTPCDCSCSAPAQQLFYSLVPNSAVKHTLIKSYFSEREIFLLQLLKGKPSHPEYFIKLIYVARV